MALLSLYSSISVRRSHTHGTRDGQLTLLLVSYGRVTAVRRLFLIYTISVHQRCDKTHLSCRVISCFLMKPSCHLICSECIPAMLCILCVTRCTGGRWHVLPKALIDMTSKPTQLQHGISSLSVENKACGALPLSTCLRDFDYRQMNIHFRLDAVYPVYALTSCSHFHRASNIMPTMGSTIQTVRGL